MPQFELICFVLMLVAALDVVACKIRLPYPVLMVLSGLALGFIPGVKGNSGQASKIDWQASEFAPARGQFSRGLLFAVPF